VQIRNETPHSAGMSVLFDKRGVEQLVVAVKGTWLLQEGREPLLAPEPEELRAADEHYGEPGKSSIRYDADLGAPKLGTDVALVGSACPRERGARSMRVSLRVGGLVKEALVVGERHWRFGFAGIWVASRPQPLRKLPLVWELAVGGSDDTPRREKRHSLDLRNPLGRGFRARSSKLARRGALLPQIIGTGWRGARTPIGFGFIGPGWEPRRRWVGTYDDAWREERCPLLPLDFDERFFNAAAPGLIARPHLRGGERVEVSGCTPSGRLAFSLPAERIAARAEFGRLGSDPIELRLCTVTIATDELRLSMVWRGALALRGRLPRFQALSVTREAERA
jgi:hypothetical protein